MVFDSINNSELYRSLHPSFEEAFAFLRDRAGSLEPGRYELRGDDVYVMISDNPLKETCDAALEAHRCYIDIQMVLSGRETFGWSPLANCSSPCTEFNNENDIIFFDDSPASFVTAGRGQFLIFFPTDAHAPLIGEGSVRKAIVKVRV